MTNTRQEAFGVGFFLMPTENRVRGTVPRWSELLATVRRAEELGYDSVWLPDHLIIDIPRPGAQPEGAWEGWSLAASLAAATERIGIGMLVTCTAFRNPALLAKMADAVDEISGGRLILGLGAGWCKLEFDMFGYPYDHRVSRFEEALQIIALMLREGHVNFQGTYYQARDCELRPRGPRPGGPAILIGSSSKGVRMLGLVARYADIWNRDFDAVNPECEPYSTEDLLRSQEKVAAACAAIGRDPNSLGRTVGVWVDLPDFPQRSSWNALRGAPEQIAAGLRAYRDAGYSEVQVWLQEPSVAAVEAFAPALDLVKRG